MKIIENGRKGNKVENSILPATEDEKIHDNKGGGKINEGGT